MVAVTRRRNKRAISDLVAPRRDNGAGCVAPSRVPRGAQSLPVFRSSCFASTPGETLLLASLRLRKVGLLLLCLEYQFGDG